MFKINLVPEVQEQKQKTTKTTTTVTSFSIGAVIVVGVALMVVGGIIATNRVVIGNTNRNIQEKKTEVAKYAELEKTVLSLEKGLTEAKKILDGNSAWTKLLPHLEGATPADVTFTSITLEPGKIAATLTGKDVNSLARFVDSYKAYTVLVLHGTGAPGETVTLEANGQTTETKVRLDGTYIATTKINPAENSTAVVKTAGQEITVTYDAAAKSVTTSDASLVADIKPLFSKVSVNQYSKTSTVTFSAEIIYDGSMLW